MPPASAHQHATPQPPANRAAGAPPHRALAALAALHLLACGPATLAPPPDARDFFDLSVSGDPCAPGQGTPPTNAEFRVNVGGTPRSFWVTAPPALAHQRVPLVLNFHGFLHNAQIQREGSGMDATAAKHGFIVVYPEGHKQSWNAGRCCADAGNQPPDDVTFAATLITWMQARYCIDPTRIHATGFSNGGMLAHRLACELAPTIRSIATVGAIDATLQCTPSRPVPVLMMHGTADDFVPFAGNPLLGFPSVRASAAQWAQRNGCGPQPVTTFAEGDTRCETYQGCRESATVQLCVSQGAGHTWPGGSIVGPAARNLNANAHMWQFFTQPTPPAQARLKR